MSYREPVAYRFGDTGVFPNSKLPVLVYPHILQLPGWFKAHFFRKLFASHGWTNAWDAGVFTYHHYHSTANEVLGFYEGATDLRIGGVSGIKIRVKEGDVFPRR